MPRLPPDAEESPDPRKRIGSRRDEFEADVRPLTKAELESMRDEFTASAEWADRELALAEAARRNPRHGDGGS